MVQPTQGGESIDIDAIALLVTDQDELAELFERYEALSAENAPSDEREPLAEEICSLFLVHAALKEEIFYPAVRTVIDEEYLVDEALIAIDAARSLIDDIQSGDSTEPSFDAQMKMLQEQVNLHTQEERAGLFARVRETALDLEQLGSELAERQEVLLSINADAIGDAP